jgi:hypothetical protein
MNLEKFEDIRGDQFAAILKTGNLSSLPIEYQEYYNMMDFSRGLSAKMTYEGQLLTRNKVIRMVRENFHISQETAKRVYEDAINFFYQHTSIKIDAFSNMYAQQLEDMAKLAASTGDLKSAKEMINDAAKLRGCFDKKQPEIPKEMYRKQYNIYTMDVTDLGLEPEDKKELDEFIDSLPDIPVIKKERLKREAGTRPFDIMKNMSEDFEQFVDEEDETKKNS